MKKAVAVLLVITAALSLFACKKTPDSNAPQNGVSEENTSSAENTAQKTPEALTLRKIDPEKIIVVYFDVREGVKATAEAFCAELGCTSFEIVPLEPYPEDETEMLARAAEEFSGEKYPALGKYLDNASDYLAMIAVYPELNGSVPMVLKTFLDDYDLRRTAILPVCVCSGENSGESFAQIKDFMAASPVYSGLEVHEGDDIAAQCKSWAEAELK